MDNEKNTDTENTLPEWFLNELATPFKAQISSVFILHGDINGLLKNPDAKSEQDRPYITLKQLFEKIFDERKIVIFYNIASGARFLTPEMEKDFRKMAGLDADGDKDPISAAKANLAQKRGIPREPEACLPLIEKALKTSTDVAVVINSVHFIAPAASGGISLPANERTSIERIKNWAQDEEIKANGNIIVLMTEQLAKVSAELRQSDNGIKTVLVPKPSRDERKAFIDSITENNNEEYKTLQKRLKKLNQNLSKLSPSSEKYFQAKKELEEITEKISSFPKLFPTPKDFDLEIFSLATQGMNLRQVLEIFLHSQKTGKEIDLEYVKEKKKEILNNEYGDTMEVVEPERGLEDIGGLEHIKAYFKNILDAIKRGESRLVSMGITLMGPPGTGKTAIVEALAKEAGFNFVKTKNIRSMWVGESEARMEKLIYGLRSLAPVVVMNDEADLAEADRNSPKGDSGVSERLMKAWMELLSDPKIRGKIIVISCTNRPDRMDAALKRSGRSDDRILLPMPSETERSAIFQVMFKRHKIPSKISCFDDFAKITEGLSGADLEKITLNSYRFAFEHGKEKVDEDLLKESIDDFIPNASQAEIDRMTLMAILESSSRRLLPPHVKKILSDIQSRNLVENLGEIITQIKTRNIAEIDE